MDRSEILSKTDLSDENLAGVSLGGCDLSGKILRGVDLSFAHLGGANLRGADLRNANLYQANFGAADLTGADLRFADLRMANFEGAVMIGADVRDARTDKDFKNDLLSHSPAAIVQLKETEDFCAAKADGYFPLAYWGDAYRVENGETLCRNINYWHMLKKAMGRLIFADKKAYGEVKLVQQYQNYSQWAYMISRSGFELIAEKLGIKLKPKETTTC